MEQMKTNSKSSKAPLIILSTGIVLIIISLIVASNEFNNGEGYYYNSYLGKGAVLYWSIIYDDVFGDFFKGEFFNFSCFYGYILIAGVILSVVGIILLVSESNAEKSISDGTKENHNQDLKEVFPNNSENLVNRLMECKKLFDSGVITQEEFDRMKKRIMESKE